MGACAGDEPEPPGLSEHCEQELERVRAEPPAFTPHSVRGIDQRLECGPVDIAASGDYEAAVSGLEVVVSVDTFHGGDVPEQARYLSAAMPLHLSAPDGSRFRVGFNVAPGTYRGDGAYELTEEGIEVPGDVGTVRTPLGANAFVEVIAPPGAEPPFVRFDQLGAPCRLNVSRAGSRGQLSCPELRAEDGRTVRLDWTWRTHRDPQATPASGS